MMRPPMMGPIDFQYLFPHNKEASGVHQHVWLPIFLKISSFVFSRRKKLAQV